ncbi:MAG: hypothetical protein V3S24_09590 [Candidatus Tectomicrobia bacterium]
MASSGRTTIDLDMTFPVAGVVFTIQVRPGDDAEGSRLHIQLQAVEAGKDARFVPESSQPLADFVGGLCRWLDTKGVTVSHTDQDVSGHFDPRYTVPRTLTTTQELCEMLEDKFGLYPHSILMRED